MDLRPLLLAAAFFCASSPAQGGAWRFAGDAGLGHDSNPANARDGAETAPAGFFSAGLSAEYQAGLSRNTGFMFRPAVTVERYAEHEKLSLVRAAGLLRGFFRPGEGFYAPLLALWTSAAYADFGSRIRDGAEYRGGAYLQEQITTRLSARLGLQWSERAARAAAFDLGGRSALLNLDWAPVQALNIYLGYQRYQGDLVSTAVSPPLAEAATADDAFGPGQLAFRLDSTAHLATLGFNYALGAHWALDLQAQSIRAKSRTGTRYERELLTLNLLTRW